MKCPHCGEEHFEFGANGEVFCASCAQEVEDVTFTLYAEHIAEYLDDFLDSVDPEDKELALEYVQNWLDKKAEAI